MVCQCTVVQSIEKKIGSDSLDYCGEDILGEKVNTKPFGEIEVDKKQIIRFPDGILGFDYIDTFVILEEENSPFVWLQAYSEPSLAFVAIQPVDFMGEYELVISHTDLEAVSVKKPDELLVLAIVTIPANNPEEMTANLQGPIIINPKMRIGRQAISLSEKYRVKHKIIEEMKYLSSNGG